MPWPISTSQHLRTVRKADDAIFVWAQNEEAVQAGAGSKRETEIGHHFMPKQISFPRCS